MIKTTGKCIFKYSSFVPYQHEILNPTHKRSQNIYPMFPRKPELNLEFQALIPRSPRRTQSTG